MKLQMGLLLYLILTHLNIMSYRSFALTIQKNNELVTDSVLLIIYWKDQLIDFNCSKFLILGYYKTPKLFSLQLSLLWLWCWMGIMSAYLPMDKLERGRHLQWREHLKIGESTIGLWRSCFEFPKRKVVLWDMNCLLACWRFTIRR